MNKLLLCYRIAKKTKTLQSAFFIGRILFRTFVASFFKHYIIKRI